MWDELVSCFFNWNLSFARLHPPVDSMSQVENGSPHDLSQREERVILKTVRPVFRCLFLDHGIAAYRGLFVGRAAHETRAP